MYNLSDLYVSNNSKVIEAIKAINKTSAYIALVIDKEKRLIGTITDGDIRRGLLTGETLNSKVSKLMKKNFFSIREGDLSKINIDEIFKRGIMQIPILDREGKVKELLQKENFIKRFENTISAVVIMAGGKGKRLMPYTSDCPKPMLSINGKPMLEIILEKCINYGFNRFYISVNYLKDQIINYFGDGNKWGVQIEYLYEEKPLGTAGSLKLIPRYEKLKNSILNLNGDIITNLDLSLLSTFHEKHCADMTIAAKHDSYTIPYGVINTTGLELDKIIEKPTYNFLVSAGIYIIKPFILKYIKESNFCDMPDLISIAKQKGFKVFTFPIHEYWLDVGRPETLEKVSKELPLN